MLDAGAGAFGHLRSLHAIGGTLLTIAFALSLLTLYALSQLTGEVLEGETMSFDQAVLEWMGSRDERWLELAALEVTALGNTLVLGAICVVAASFLRLAGRSDYSLLLIVALLGGGALNFTLKAIFARPRPEVFDWRVTHAGFASFPSGHATMSMAVFAVMAYAIHRLTRNRWVEVSAILVAGTTVLLIGLSRVYLGVHYPSDVLAGFGVGFVWAVFCVWGAELMWHLRELGSRNSDPGEQVGLDNDGRAEAK